MAEKLLKYKMLFVWMAVAVLVCLGIGIFRGSDMAVDFAAAYLMEFSLSIDNLFVFLMVFTSFGISGYAQHRVLSYGIYGAVILRLLFIVAGIAIINALEWILYIFGAILVVSGLKMFKNEDDEDPRDGRIFRIIQRLLPMTREYCGEKFFVRNEGHYRDTTCRLKWLATPLFGIILLIEFSDIIFAIDSVPAVLSMTRNLFIVYSSNILAILGLRQLFFVVEDMHNRFCYVRYGVALILCFTGVKMLLGIIPGFEISNIVSIGIIAGILVASIVISVIVSGKKENSGK